ncbi:unnamed protein product [Prorocentrum cordatum]|uniref:UBC core domain-containing protein n=1 Tax=Prorocentrum cordatum TaxID=2364126 RepID=A0ABN9V5T5_9DINO|nr:unnamed protein product [Polarella glacialis]
MESVLFRLWVHRRQASWLRPSKSTLWHGLEDAGDGFRCGNPLKLTSRLSEYADYGSNQSDTTPQVNLEHLTRYVGNSKQVSMTRLHCVKELFGTFVNRMQAYDFQADVGLVLFSTSASMVCKPTLITENFRDRVNQAEASGHTALYDAVDLAASALEEWRAAWRAVPGRAGNPALRVIVLSDGQDTKSRTVPWKLARRLQQADILLDAVHVGSNDMDDSLHAIAKSTGGYVFKPASVQEALRLHELEVVLHSPERPPLARRPPPITRAVDLRKFFAARYPADRADESAVPARRQPAQLEAPFVSLESAVRLLAAAGAGADAAGQAPEQPRQGGAARQRRLLREMRALMRAPHPNFDVYPCETDLGFWRLVLAMDQGADVFTPYAGGCWLMYVSFPEEYPERPPEVRFVTPICHTNTNAHGKICHSILGRNYTTDTPVSSILGSVYALVLTPDTEDAVDTALAFQSHEDPDGYRRKIAEHVQQNATARSRAEWRCQLEDSRNT